MLRPLMIYKTDKDGNVIRDARGEGVLCGKLLPDGSIEGEHPMTDVEMKAAGHFRFHENERHEQHEPEVRDEDLRALTQAPKPSEPETPAEQPAKTRGKKGR